MQLPTIIEALKFRAEQMGWGQERMAIELGLQASHYSEVLSGKRRLPLRAMRKACKLGVPAKVLLQ